MPKSKRQKVLVPIDEKSLNETKGEVFSIQMYEANWHMARDAGTKERPTYQHMGGTRLTTTAIPFSQADWIQHYGPVWESFRDAKKRFDPNNVLTPGQGRFPSPIDQKQVNAIHSPLFRRKKDHRRACRQISVACYVLTERVCR